MNILHSSKSRGFYGFAVGFFAWNLAEALVFALSAIDTVNIIVPYIYPVIISSITICLLPLRKLVFRQSYEKYIIKISLNVLGLAVCIIFLQIIHELVELNLTNLFKSEINKLFFYEAVSDSTYLFFFIFFISIFLSKIENGIFFRQYYITAGLITALISIFLYLAFFFSDLIPISIIKIIISIFSIACLSLTVDYLNKKISLGMLIIRNGALRGHVFYLEDRISYIGSQSTDDLNLSQYFGINHSHAKLIPYGRIFSLADNDPYCRTFINSKYHSERILKNQDFITIGNAKLEFRSI